MCCVYPNPIALHWEKLARIHYHLEFSTMFLPPRYRCAKLIKGRFFRGRRTKLRLSECLLSTTPTNVKSQSGGGVLLFSDAINGEDLSNLSVSIRSLGVCSYMDASCS